MTTCSRVFTILFLRRAANHKTIFQQFVNCVQGAIIHPFVGMKVQGIGELTDHDMFWHLAYDNCIYVQAFARDGLDDPEGAAFYVRRHYAQCLTCALFGRPPAAEAPDLESDQFHLLLTLDELVVTIAALRVVDQAELADRLDAILRQMKPAAPMRQPPEAN